MYPEGAGGGADIAIVIREHPLDVLPLHPSQGNGLGGRVLRILLPSGSALPQGA